MEESLPGAATAGAALSAYLPQDRRRAAAAGSPLPARAAGALLFVDISGFTPLTERLARDLGRRRGADALTRLLNEVYTALIALVDASEGSVIGFSGDAFTVWFAAGEAGGEGQAHAARRALATANRIQLAMAAWANVEVAPGVRATPTVKCALAAGLVSRFTVGDPSIQLLDVLTGAPLEALAAAELLAAPGEIVADAHFLAALGAQRAAIEARGEGFARLVPSAAEAELFAHIRPPALPVIADADQWLPAPVAAAIRSGHERFLAELRPAVALFVRFGRAGRTDDDATGKGLDAWFRQTQQRVAAEEGTIIQLTTGDKGSYLYAAFGAPIAHEDDVVRAVSVGLALAESAPAAGPIVDVCCGVSRGVMRVGAYGGPTRRAYGVLGAETNRAARLMMRAAPGQLLATQEVAAVLADTGGFLLEALGPMALKGTADATHVSAVRRAPLFARGGERPETSGEPLIGREAELATLCSAWREHGGGAVLLVEGAPGIGKSRLVAEVVAQAQRDGIHVLYAACTSVLQHAPFAALRPLLLGLLGVTGGAEMLAAQLERLRVDLPQWAERLPLLADALGAPAPESAFTLGLDAKARLAALSGLVVEMAREHATRAPLLLVVEDAHWLDEASQALLAALAEETTKAPLLLLQATRPKPTGIALLDGDHPGWTHILLTELDEGGSAALLAQRLGGPADLLLADVVQALAQGNPFYLEELAGALLETEQVVCTDGLWRLSDATCRALRSARCLGEGEMPRLRAGAALSEVDLGLPPSLQGLVLARLDRLPEVARLTLKVASVFGHDFDLPLLAQVPLLAAAASFEQLHSAVVLSLERDFVRAAANRYAFKHAITREVTYGALLEEQQQEIHLAVGELLEVQRPDAIEEVAHHFVRSNLARPDVRVRAVVWLEAAAARAARDYANETALVWLDQALALEARPSLLRTRIQVLHVLARREAQRETLDALAAACRPPEPGDALLWSDYHEAIGDFDAANTALASGLAQVDSGVETARVLVRLGLIAWRRGDYTHAEERFSAALAALQHAPDALQERADACYGLGLAARQLGRLDDAQEHFRHDLALNQALGNRVHEARALTALGAVESLHRNFTAALGWFEQALAIRRAIGDRAGVGAGLLTLAQTQGSMGDLAAALPLLNEALRVQQAIHNRWEECLVWNELGISHMLLGDFAAAAHALEQGLAGARAIGSDIGVAYLTCNLGQVQRDAGDLALAETTLRAGLALAAQQEDIALEAIYRGDLALTLLHAGHFAEAQTMAQAAVRLNLELEQEPPLTALHATLAQAALGLGNRAEALAQARAAYNLLDRTAGEGVDFPQRDYWMCAQVLQACGEPDAATAARRAALRHLNEKAERLSDPALRTHYLANSALHREIRQQPTQGRNRRQGTQGAARNNKER